MAGHVEPPVDPIVGGGLGVDVVGLVDVPGFTEGTIGVVVDEQGVVVSVLVINC